MFCSCCVPAVRFCPGRSFSSNPTACFDPTHPQHSKGKPPLSSSCQPNQQCVEVSQTHFNWSCSLSLLPLLVTRKRSSQTTFSPGWCFLGLGGMSWRVSVCLSKTRTVQLYLSCRCVPSLWFLWPEEKAEEECGVMQHWCALRLSQEVFTALMLAGGRGKWNGNLKTFLRLFPSVAKLGKLPGCLTEMKSQNWLIWNDLERATYAATLS